MTQIVRILVDQYVIGWKENDVEKIVSVLTSDCTIIESHGPTYHGHKSVRKWLEFWIKDKGKVTKWDINSFYYIYNKYIDNKQIVFFEWDFACKVQNKEHELLGISIVKFKGNKISFLHEYRMTKNPYEWQPTKLMPE